MRKWIGILGFWLLVLLIASPCFAAGPEIFMGGGTSAAAAGSSWSCADASLLCESFDATGYDTAGWSETAPANTTIDEDYAYTTALGNNNPNVQSLRISRTAAGADVAKTEFSTTSNSEHYGAMRFRVVSVTNAANTDETYIFYSYLQFSRFAIRVNWIRIAGLNVIKVQHTTQADAPASDVAIADYTFGDWVLVEWHWKGNQATGGLTVKINGSSITIADTSTADYTASIISCYVDSYRASVIDIDTIKVNASSAPAN